MAEDPQESKDVFSVNDFDIEDGIFNLVIALVQQKAQRMEIGIAKEATIKYLNQIINGLEQHSDTNDKIADYITKQKDGDIS